MKPAQKILLGALLLTGLQFGLGGCVADGYVRGRGYYGPGPGPWFHDDPWMDGDRWYGEPRGGRIGIYLHPPRR